MPEPPDALRPSPVPAPGTPAPTAPASAPPVPFQDPLQAAQAFHPREHEDFAYAYAVVSRRSGGVSIGVNLNPDKACNFDCPYCQVDRSVLPARGKIDLDRLVYEVRALVLATDEQGVSRLPRFSALPAERRRLRDVALSGDGEPTMAPEFPEACRRLRDLQKAARAGTLAREDGSATGSRTPAGTGFRADFKLILITNATLLDREPVRRGIGFLLEEMGEVWAKLDAGSEAWYQRVNVSKVSLDRVQEGITALGRVHPVTLQSFFCRLGGEAPSTLEMDRYLGRLQAMKAAGARIREVQLHTLARKPANSEVGAVEGSFLEEVRRRILEEVGIEARIYGLGD